MTNHGFVVHIGTASKTRKIEPKFFKSLDESIRYLRDVLENQIKIFRHSIVIEEIKE